MICSGGGILFAADLQALNIERIMPDEIVRPLTGRLRRTLYSALGNRRSNRCGSPLRSRENEASRPHFFNLSPRFKR